MLFSGNGLLPGLRRVGSLEVQDFYDAHPAIRRLPLHSYPSLKRYPEHLVEAAASAARQPCMLPPLGLETLRGRLASDLAAVVGATIDPSCIAVTNGAQAALQLAWFALLDAGDEVVVPAPNYYVEGSIRMAGGIFRPVPAMSTSAIAWDTVTSALGPRAKVLFLTNPNNPVGHLLKPKDLAVLEEILEAHPRLWLVVDESYERIRHEGRAHLPCWTSPVLRERCLMIRSLSKSCALSWLRVGWLAAPAALMPALRKVVEWQQLYGSCVNQAVALAALEGDQAWLASAFEGFTEGRDRLQAVLAGIEGCRVGLPEAGPFLFPDIGGTGRGADAVMDLRRNGISAVEGEYFGVGGACFRMPVGGDRQTLAEAASVLASVFAR